MSPWPPLGVSHLLLPWMSWRGRGGGARGVPPGWLCSCRAVSQRGSCRCPRTNPDLLGALWWLLGVLVLPHLPVAEQEGSRCVAVTPEQSLPTFLLILLLLQALSSSPAWESSCCPEPTATILYKVIFPLSAENNTKVTPSHQRFQKKPNTSLARFRFNLIISLKRGFVFVFVSFSGKKKKKSFFLPFLLRPLSEGQ